MAKVKVKGKKKAAKPAVDDSKIGKTVGVKSGACVSETWNAVLIGNAKAKKTDVSLLKTMKAEFPGRKKFQPVGRIRSFFNRGVQGFGNPPGTNVRGTGKESFAYDANGKKTDSTDWGQDRKPSAALSKLAKKRAAEQWGKKKAKAAKKAAA